MAELGRSARAALAGLGLSAAGLLPGCATAPPPEPELDLTMRRAEDERRHASPAARDALAEGLRWIVLDAPGSNERSAEPTAAAAVERPVDVVSETPPGPPAAEPEAATSLAEPGRDRQPASYTTSAELNLHAGPGLGEPVLATLPIATEVAARAVSGEWIRVETPSGEVGWVHGDWLEELAAAGDGEESETGAGAGEPITSKGVEP